MSIVIRHPSENDRPQPQLVIRHGSAITALAYFPDGRRVVTGSNYGIVKIWNLENSRLEGRSMKHKALTHVVSVTRDGTKIISGSWNGSIMKVWDAKSHELVKEWPHEAGCDIVSISPDVQLIAVAGGSNVGVYTVQGRLANMVVNSKPIRSAAFSPDGKKLACGTEDGDILIYDLENGTLILGPSKGHKDLVNSVLWSRDGRRLFSGSRDKTIRCWNSDTGEQIRQPWTGHTRWIHSLSLSPDGWILASASEDETVRFWDATSGYTHQATSFSLISRLRRVFVFLVTSSLQAYLSPQTTCRGLD